MTHIASQWYLYSKVIRSTNEQIIGFIINNQQVHRSDPIRSDPVRNHRPGIMNHWPTEFRLHHPRRTYFGIINNHSIGFVVECYCG